MNDVGKIAVVSDPDVATYFRIAGVKNSYEIAKPEEASGIVESLANDKEVAIIIVTEKIAERVKPVIDVISRRVYPTIITIPGREGPGAEKISPILDLVKRTVGVDIKV